MLSSAGKRRLRMVDGILIGLTALRAAYFVVIVVYADIGTSFALIWLFLTALLLFLIHGKWYYARNLDRVPGWVSVSVVTTCAVEVAVPAMLYVPVSLGAAASTKSNLDYVVVLGTRVKGRTINNPLRKRLDKAVRYVENNPDTILVLSGGEGPGESTNETEVMYQYLVCNSVGSGQLLIEDHSESTMESVACSKMVIEQHRKKNQKVLVSLRQETTSMSYAVAPDWPLETGIFTSNFHIYRARMTAEERGLDNVYGISVGPDPVLFIHLCVRECTSIVKDRLMGNMRSIAMGLRLPPLTTVSHNKQYKLKQLWQTIR